MNSKRRGKQTVALTRPPSIAGFASVVGKKEGEGPLAATFDQIGADDTFGETSWEKAESKGILDGTRPHDPVTRQDLASVLDRIGALD